MEDLDDLYKEVILDHTKKPRNYGKLKEFNRKSDGHNPLCGDRLSLYLVMDGDNVKDIRFEGAGCSIFKSSASIMTEEIKSKTKDEIEKIYQEFHYLLTREPHEDIDPDDYGKLAAFSGVCEFPVRIKCASLPWHTLRNALEGKSDTSSTE